MREVKTISLFFVAMIGLFILTSCALHNQLDASNDNPEQSEILRLTEENERLRVILAGLQVEAEQVESNLSTEIDRLMEEIEVLTEENKLLRERSVVQPDVNIIKVNIDNFEWIDLDVIKIPSFFSYEEVGLHGEILIKSDILNLDLESNNFIHVGPLKGIYEDLVDSAVPFVFDDGHVGIFMESFDFGTMAWIREDGNLITFRYGNDISIFTNIENLILKIALSLR